MEDVELSAKAWLIDTFDVSRETMATLEGYVALLVDAAARHNLISASTISTIWNRHIRDSAQLLLHEDPAKGSWLDVGSGAGLPGIVIAILSDARMMLVESRRLRATFLAETAGALGLSTRLAVAWTDVERLESSLYDVITARAFAALPQIFSTTLRFAGPDTIWILPKGKSAHEEVAAARAAWQGDFEVVASVTDPEAGIVIARNVKPRRKR